MNLTDCSDLQSNVVCSFVRIRRTDRITHELQNSRVIIFIPWGIGQNEGSLGWQFLLWTKSESFHVFVVEWKLKFLRPKLPRNFWHVWKTESMPIFVQLRHTLRRIIRRRKTVQKLPRASIKRLQYKPKAIMSKVSLLFFLFVQGKFEGAMFICA